MGITALKKPLFVLREESETALRNGEDEDGSAAANLEWMPTLRSRTVVGWWMGPLSELELLLRQLRFEELWVGSDYRLLSRNCNHFARSMCAALLRNPLFKPAPGCSRPEDMVPQAVTRLPALVLALSCCMPCIVRRLNAPMPLAPHALNVFQGQSRKAAPEGGRLRSRSIGGRHITASVSSRVSISANASGMVEVRQSSASTSASVLRVGSAPGGSVAAGLRGYRTVGWPAGSTPTVTPDGQLPRPRLQGRYQALRVETATKPTAVERVPQSSSCRQTESSGGAGGPDTAGEASGVCPTPDRAAAAATAAAEAAATVGPTLSSASAGQLNGHCSLSPKAEVVRNSPFTSVTAAATAHPGDRTGTPDGVGPVSVGAAAVAAAAAAAATAGGGACAGLSNVPTSAFSVSLPPPVVVLEAANGVASSTPTSAVSGGGGGSTPPQRASGPKFLNPSRSGRRVFPDPRATSLGADSTAAVADAAQDSATALAQDSIVSSRGFVTDGSVVREPTRNDSDLGPTAAPPLARESDAGMGPGPVVRHLASVQGLCASPRQATASASCRSQHYTPRSSGSGLPPLALQQLPRLEASPAKPPAAPLPLPPSQATHQPHPQPHVNMPYIRGTAATTDGVTSAAGMRLSPTDQPRPWSVLSGGFVDLLFSPSGVVEPPPGVPNAAALGAGGGSGPGGGRRYSSVTGDGGLVLSGNPNATVVGVGGIGGLETVNSGDLSDDVPQGSPLKAAAVRARASTGTVASGAVGGGAGQEMGGAAAAAATASAAPAATTTPAAATPYAAVVPTSGMGAAAAAAANPLRPSSTSSRAASRTGTGQGAALPLVGPAAPAAAAPAAAAAVAADGNAAVASPTSRRGH